jgi:DUF4097 and DUF4098 domain-containing protein YvlB
LILTIERRSIMSRIAIACLTSLVALSLLFAPAMAASEAEYEEEYSKVEPLPADGKVYLMNISGDVEIQTWNRNEVKVNAMKRSTAGSVQKAKANADRLKIEVRREDGRLKIETKYPEGHIELRKFNVSVDYTLTVPARASVTVNTVSGDVLAANMAGLAKLTSVSGDVRAERMKSGGVFTTVSGDVELSQIAGDVEASDVSGDISLSDLSGSVKAETVSGDVVAARLSGARSVSISVHSGEITYDGALNPVGRYAFETHSGPVTVTLPANAAFDFESETFSGSFRSEFKMRGDVDDEGRRHGHDMRVTVNGGGADVSIETFSGSIELRKSD